MNPPDAEARLGRLEREVSEDGQKIADITRAVDRLLPHGESIVELRTLLVGVREDVQDNCEKIKEVRKVVVDTEAQRALDANERRKERRADRLLLWSLTGGIAAAVVTAVGAIIAAGIS